MAPVSARMAVYCMAITITVFLLLTGTGGHAQVLSPAPPSNVDSKPLLAIKGGYASYGYNYRSNIDTPFTEKNIGQHNAVGYIDVLVGNHLPLKVNYWIRRSNSAVFRDVTDVQVMFDPGGLRNNIINQQRQRLGQLAQFDSLPQELYQSELQQLKGLSNKLSNPFTIQQIREYRELLQKPELSYEPGKPDSVNKKRTDSVQQSARFFLALYDSSQQRYRRLSHEVDSLGKAADDAKRRWQRYRQAINGQGSSGDWYSYNQWQKELQQYEPSQPPLPNQYKWLMGIRTMSVGKSPVNYSELTAKNISVTGINFEYNSWYYLAVTAGVVDYRFRDFVVNRLSKSPQYLYMLRLGLGRLEKNYFIVSAFRGRKQLYASTDNSSVFSSINITGFSAAGKWQLNRNSYVTAEAAQSLSPNYLTTPVANAKFTFNDNSNKALSFKLYAYLPQTGGRIEGMYKFTGANYQSFSSFQTNAAARSWYVKWEQPFFNRHLRLTASLRSNEFTNPYIVQQYKSNTVFKSISAVYRAKRLPTITLGYVPMSQLTMVGTQLLESRFQILTGSISHFYKLGTQRASTMLVINKFFNGGSDSGFIYFNSTNIYCTQQFMFRAFTASTGISYSSNGQYKLNVLDESFSLYAWKTATIGFGVKVNSFNKESAKLGKYINSNVRIGKKDMLYISYEQGYLPGIKQLVRNDMASIQLSRYF
jgi:hypothetical protein